MALSAAESGTRMLIVSDVPLVAWGIQSSLIGLPGIDVRLGAPQEDATAAGERESRAEVVVAAPAGPRVELCLRLAAWRRGARPSMVVCLAPGSCGRHCHRADVTASLDETSPADLRLLLRHAVSRAQARDEAREKSVFPGDCRPSESSAPEVLRISAREREVGLLVAEGCNSGEIAVRLFISHRTVEKHRSNLMAKLGVSNAAALTRELLYLCWTEGAALPEARG